MSKTMRQASSALPSDRGSPSSAVPTTSTAARGALADFDFGGVQVIPGPSHVAARTLLDRLGPGEPLPSSVRGPMESRLGYRFGAVRIHRGGVGAAEATARGASAVTVDQHIAFATGAYQPGTLAGDALLAHELAHTVHQRGPEHGVAPANDAILEAEADALAADAALDKTGRRLHHHQGLRIQAAGCAWSVPSGTLITAAHFNFQTHIAPTGSPALSGGWQVACLHATLSKTIHRGPTSTFLCRIEIGMPIIHHAWGRISHSDAATRTAAVANTVAYSVLSTASYPVTQADCNALHKALQVALNAPVGGKTLGARVSDCVTPGITPTTFP